MAFCTKCGTAMTPEAVFCPNCGNPVGQTTAAPSGSTNELDNLMKDSSAQEHWLQRLVAFIIDAVIVGVAFSVIAIIILLSIRLSLGGFFGLLYLPSIGSLGGGIVLVLYFVVAETLYGKTIGKSLLHLRVVMVNDTRLDFGKAFIRNISKIYWLLLLLDIIGGLVTKTKRGQKFTDHIANTNVIKDTVG